MHFSLAGAVTWLTVAHLTTVRASCHNMWWLSTMLQDPLFYYFNHTAFSAPNSVNSLQVVFSKVKIKVYFVPVGKFVLCLWPLLRCWSNPRGAVGSSSTAVFNVSMDAKQWMLSYLHLFPMWISLSFILQSEKKLTW